MQATCRLLFWFFRLRNVPNFRVLAMPAYNKFRLFSFIIIPQCWRCWEKKTDIDHFFMKMKKKNAPATTNHNRISASLVWNVINQKCVIISHAAFTLRAIFVWLIWFCVQTKQKMIHNCKHFHYFIVSFCLCFLVAAAVFCAWKMAQKNRRILKWL